MEKMIPCTKWCIETYGGKLSEDIANIYTDYVVVQFRITTKDHPGIYLWFEFFGLYLDLSLVKMIRHRK